MYTPTAKDLEDPSVLEYGGVSAVKKKPSNHVRFYRDAKQDMRASEKEGRPIYKDVEMVEIFAQGGNTTVKKEMTEDLKERFSVQYQAWIKGQEMAVDGLPLEKWPHKLMTPGMIHNLKYFKIYSVEQLAELTDGTIQKIGPGAMMLRQDAIEYLENASGMPALKQENVELKERLSALEAQLEALSKPKKRGRGKKADESIDDYSSSDERAGDS